MSRRESSRVSVATGLRDGRGTLLVIFDIVRWYLDRRLIRSCGRII